MNRLGTIALIIVGVVALYKLSYPTYSCRYRMTVNVEVDGQMRSGLAALPSLRGQMGVAEQPASDPGHFVRSQQFGNREGRSSRSA